MSPDQIAKSGTESAIQSALFSWLRKKSNIEAMPELEWVHHIPNGGARDGITASRLKAEGVKAGVLDIFVPACRTIDGRFYGGLYVEMKRKVKGKTKDQLASPEQHSFAAYAIQQGYSCCLCDDWRDARAAILTYLGYDIPND